MTLKKNTSIIVSGFKHFLYRTLSLALLIQSVKYYWGLRRNVQPPVLCTLQHLPLISLLSISQHKYSLAKAIIKIFWMIDSLIVL